MAGMGLTVDEDLAPPSEGRRHVLNVTSGTASAATLTNTGEGGFRFSWVCLKTHNVNFSDDGTNTVTDPANTPYFNANTVYSVRLSAKNTYFKVTPSADGSVLYWISSKG